MQLNLLPTISVSSSQFDSEQLTKLKQMEVKLNSVPMMF